jgi:hypothetical protein
MKICFKCECEAKSVRRMVAYIRRHPAPKEGSKS